MTEKLAPLLPWIRWIQDEEASGVLKQELDAAVGRAGKVYNIVRIMSLNPGALSAAMRLYLSTLRRRSERLGRPEREMIAVVVSQANHCHY